MIELNQRRSLIQQFPCFKVYASEEASELAKLMSEVDYSPNDTIVQEGDPVDSFYLIVEGTAEVFQKKIIDGKQESQLIAALGPGEAIGLNEIGFFSKTGFRTATVVATSNIKLLKLSLPKLSEFLNQHTHLNKAMTEATGKMLKTQMIKKAAPFARLSNERINWLLEHAKEITLAPNEIIFNEGEMSHFCYLILSGVVEIFLESAEGKITSLAKLKKPELFGEAALITTGIRNASARALKKTELLVVQKEDFLELLATEKESNDAVVSMMFERARPIVNNLVIINHRQTSDNEIITTLKNPEENRYYQLTKEGWFVYQHLDGKHTLQDISKEFKKVFHLENSYFVYDLISDLINNKFASYTPSTVSESRISIISYDANELKEISGAQIEDFFPNPDDNSITWVRVEGHSADLVLKLADRFHLHPVTVEDIINIKQRAKIQVFEHYICILIKKMKWNNNNHTISTEQIALILGKNFILSFQEEEDSLFQPFIEKLHTKHGKFLRSQGTDYLLFRLIDIIIENYFHVLDSLNVQLEQLEDIIFTKPTEQHARSLYHIKHQLLIIRRAVWPVREVISHLLHLGDEYVSPATALYLRDLYEHIAQTIDTLEIYRDTIAGLIDFYLSSLSQRLNEVMKVLTVISTIFIPITFIANIFGMNFFYQPAFLHWQWAFPVVVMIMIIMIICMLVFFRRKKWL